MSIMVTFHAHARVPNHADAEHNFGSVGRSGAFVGRGRLLASAPGLLGRDDESVIAGSRPDQARSFSPQLAAGSSPSFRLAWETQPCSGLGSISQPSKQSAIELRILPNIDAAYSLAYWLTLDPVHAQTIVEDACTRTLSHLASFRSEDGKVLLLQMVRKRVYAELPIIEAALGSLGAKNDNSDGGEAANFVRRQNVSSTAETDPFHAAARALPIDLRECLVLREMEGLNYDEIARITEASRATVIGQLLRARQMLTTSQTQNSW